MVAWLQSQADLDANFFEGTRKTLEKQNWDFFGGQLDKSVALTALGFVDGVCETIDLLALGAAQLGQLALEELVEGVVWVASSLFKLKTPQWVKDDVTGAWNNVMAASEFGTRLIALDADAWNAVAKTGEKVGSDLASAIKTGDDYKIGGYLFDVATLVGPAAVGKLKYVDEASSLTKLAETSEVASTVGKVEDGVKVEKALSFEKLMSAEDAQKYAQWNKYAEAGIEPKDRVKLVNWEYKPSATLYKKFKNVYDNSLYYDQISGQIHWPVDDGFKYGTKENKVITENTLFKRYGEETGEFLGNTTDSFESRALAPHSYSVKEHYYVLTENTEMTTGEAAPWFGSNGGAKQFVKFKPNGDKYTIKELLDEGILEDVTDLVKQGDINV
ncbi:glycohydrolase toxin TNT-related protein [Streptococcus ruminicola]|uniref:Glycohydrolase toxin TNT-related protein n=1 Tax=Streptococcus ruminicola TaxID=2686210 RepID=A0AAE6R6K5_9STRE|nr:glycohydrolase toxin TNT-related protein [Streptococcus ruminicola]QGZ28302.1 glycohydrolase toxin TNT-related protein [Streptococcus ruminicola]